MFRCCLRSWRSWAWGCSPSTAPPPSQGAHQGLWTRQLAWAVIAFGVAWIVASIHYRAYDALAWPVYVVALLLLVLVLVKGSSAMGAKRWLDLGPLRFQPSELAKVATVLVLARRFDQEKLDLRRFAQWFPALLIVLVPFALVAKEPDLGTSLTFPVILIAMYFWAGMPVGQLLLGLSPVLTAVLFFLTGGLWWSAGLVAVLLGAVRPRLPTLLVVLLLNGAVGSRPAPGLEPHARLPEAAHRDLPESGRGPVPRRLPDHPVADRHRLGRDQGRRVPQGHAEGSGVPAHAPHRLHLLGGGRGVGIAGDA